MTKDLSWEQERLRYGKRQRLLRWEYWSGYWLYFPIAIYALFYLAIKHRGIFTMTAVNPAIEDGGMINESKKDILDLLKKSDDDAVPNFVFLNMLESSSRRREVTEKAFENGLLYFPVVLKPNAGQRGTGVMVISDSESLWKSIDALQEDHLLQQYCPGQEVSVFYYRYPGRQKGVIFSVTLKTLPSVDGDGLSNIKQLILKDERHVCMAEFLFKLLGDKLEDIPEKHEKVILNEIGAHCKGSKFEDGTHYAGEGLRERLDKMMRDDSGLCFGRFDLMVDKLENLKLGETIKIIELNGVTSEATHIYDPKYSVFHAWKTLAQQWKIAYEIGDIQMGMGRKSSSCFKILKQILTYRKKVKSYSGVG